MVIADETVYWADGFIFGSVASVSIDGNNSRSILCNITSPERIFVDGNYLIVSPDERILRIDR